jgi:hypothetical protein
MRNKFAADKILDILSLDVDPNDFYDSFFSEARDRNIDLPALDEDSDLGEDKDVVKGICALALRFVKSMEYGDVRTRMCSDRNISVDKAYRLSKFLSNTDQLHKESDNVYKGCERIIAVYQHDDEDSSGVAIRVMDERDGRKQERIEVEVDGNKSHVSASNTGITSIDELIDEAGIDLDRWKIVDSTVKSHDQGMKLKEIAGYDDNDNPYFTYTPFTHTLWSYTVELEKQEVDPVEFSPLKPVEVSVSSTYETNEVHTVSPGLESTMLVPDPQIGFERDLRRGTFSPLHDRRAMDLMLQIAADSQPDRIVFLGDWLDLAEWTKKYTREPEFREVTQPSLAEGSWWLKQLRMMLPDIPMHFLPGNHEQRVRDSLANHYEHAYDISAAGRMDAAPLVSIDSMLELSEKDIEVEDPYPNGEVWLNDWAKCIHGEIARKNPGKTVKKLIENETVTIVQGHVHRMELKSRMIRDRGDSVPIYGFSPGCMCRTETGIVPSASAQMNWQQGLGFIHVDPDGYFHDIEPIRIMNGACMYRDKYYTANDQVDNIRKDTEYGDRLERAYDLNET